MCPLFFYWYTSWLNSVCKWVCVQHVCFTCLHTHLCISLCANTYSGSVEAPAGSTALVWHWRPQRGRRADADRWPHTLDVRPLIHLVKTYWVLCMTSSSVLSGDLDAAEQCGDSFEWDLLTSVLSKAICCWGKNDSLAASKSLTE